jgi:hypothetical protein
MHERVKYKDQRTHGRFLNWSIEDVKPRLEQKRVAGLVLARKKPVLKGEGIKGQCSCEGTLLHT